MSAYDFEVVWYEVRGCVRTNRRDNAHTVFEGSLHLLPGKR
jgi:hypothetical protein